MDTLVINLDDANKKANLTQAKALGRIGSVLVRLYNFNDTPDPSTIHAVIYLDDGSVASSCGPFDVSVLGDGIYDAVLSLQTPVCSAYFASKPPSYSEQLTIVISASGRLYCNSKVLVKNG